LENNGIVGKIISADKSVKAKYTLTKTGLALKSAFEEAAKWGEMYNKKFL